jgi:Protein of unknown function (DUF1592)/Protein of unknown function (DUF1588)/Protein of unknown function (DUF1595)/Protein of unknown function (DUF1587)/Protein of unknown function (DUF1585)
MAARARAFRACIGSWLSISGCYVGAHGSPATASEDAGSDSDGSDGGSDAPTAAPSPMRRLTRGEYNRTVHDLLGDATAPADTFPAEDIGSGFTNNANAQSVSGLLVEDYEGAAIALAEAATEDLAALLACDPITEGEDTCMDGFIPAFGARAYRRPLVADEIDRLQALYQASKTDYDFTTAVRLTVQAMLQSPHFLYRVETGGEEVTRTTAADADGKTVDVVIRRVTGYQLASRLSYLLWSTMPDDELFAAAASGELDTPEGVEAQARRMLDDTRSQRAFLTFLSEWLYVGELDHTVRDPELFPEFTPEIRTLLAKERELFIADALSTGDLATLLAGDYSFMNQTLASYYGVGGPSSDEFERVTLDPQRGAGLLTQGAFLANYAKPNQTAPIARGQFVLSRLACIATPPPPPDIPALPEPADQPSLSTRERLEMVHLTAGASCAACHETMDELGFLFEHYDAIGRWREEDANKPVDSTIELDGMDELDGHYDGAPDFMRALVTSRQLLDCAVRQWFRFGYGRIESPLDLDTITTLEAVAAEHPGDLRELVVALTQTDAFAYRTDEGAAQ